MDLGYLVGGRDRWTSVSRFGAGPAYPQTLPPRLGDLLVWTRSLCRQRSVEVLGVDVEIAVRSVVGARACPVLWGVARLPRAGALPIRLLSLGWPFGTLFPHGGAGPRAPSRFLSHERPSRIPARMEGRLQCPSRSSSSTPDQPVSSPGIEGVVCGSRGGYPTGSTTSGRG